MRLPRRLPTSRDQRARLAGLILAGLVAELKIHGRLWRHPPPKNTLWFSRPGGLGAEERKARRVALRAEIRRRNARGITAYKKLLHMRFEQIGHEVMRNITVDVHRSCLGRRKGNVSDAELASWMFDRQRWYGTLSTDNKLLNAERLLESASEFYDDLGVHGFFDVTDPRVLRFLAMNARNAGWAITDSTYRTIMEALGRGSAEGASIPNLRNALMESLDFLTRYRAELIARTETLKASNQGLMNGMRQSGVVVAKEWLATEDDRTCFPGNTVISVPSGEAPINKIKIGDTVNTPKGLRRVAQIMRRLYFGPMTMVLGEEGREIFSTAKHPIWINDRGWTEATYVRPRDFLKTEKNELLKVASVHNIDFFKPFHSISLALKKLVFPHIFYSVPVPISTVDFQAEIERGDKKVNRISADLFFRFKPKAKVREGLLHGNLNRSLSPKFPIAGKGAEPTDILMDRNIPEFLSASFTDKKDSRSAANLGAKTADLSALPSKKPAASFADDINRVSSAAGEATDRISRSIFGHDGKLPFTDGAGFRNHRPVAAGLIAGAGAIDSIRIRRGNKKRTITNRAILRMPLPGMNVVAIPGAIFFSRLFSAIKAIVAHLKIYYRLIVNRCKSFTVYNLEVEDAHSYYANGVLVHNCEFCEALDGAIITLEEDFFSEGDVMAVEGASMALDYEDISAPPLHPDSYSKETEIYTDQGWKNVAALEKGNLCLTLNKETLDLEYHPVVGCVSHYQKEAVHFHSHDFDLLVTPRHKMLYLTDWKYKYKKTGFVFREASSFLENKSGAFYRSSQWRGQNRFSFMGFLFADFCKFMGYYLSEGSRNRNSGIVIAQKAGPKKDIMREDLMQMKLEVNETSAGFRINANRPLNRYLEQFGRSHEKYIPKEIKEAFPQSIRLFLDAFRLGDGLTRACGKYKGGNFAEEKIYYTASNKMADDLGELILKVGKRPSFYLRKSKGKVVQHRNGTYAGNHDIWDIRECGNQFATLANIRKEMVTYDDMVYCVEVAQNNTLWIRRNGKTAWSGNCRCTLLAVIDESEMQAAAGQGE